MYGIDSRFAAIDPGVYDCSICRRFVLDADGLPYFIQGSNELMENPKPKYCAGTCSAKPQSAKFQISDRSMWMLEQYRLAAMGMITVTDTEMLKDFILIARAREHAVNNQQGAISEAMNGMMQGK